MNHPHYSPYAPKKRNANGAIVKVLIALVVIPGFGLCCCGGLFAVLGEQSSSHDEAWQDEYHDEYDSYDNYDEHGEHQEFDYPEFEQHAHDGLQRPAPVGSATRLEGKQLTLVAFVNTPHKTWSSAEKQEMRRDLARAQRFLTKEARRHDRTLSFETISLDDLKISSTQLDGLDFANASVPHPSERLNARLTASLQHSPDGWLDDLRRTHGAQGAHLVVMLGSMGRSYAFPATMQRSPQLLDYTMIYHHRTQLDRTEWSTIAHEILHTYGAMDLYSEEAFAQMHHGTLKLDISQDVAKKWPDSIMLRDVKTHEGDTFYVDPFSAWLVGWSDWTDETFYRAILDGQEDAYKFW